MAVITRCCTKTWSVLFSRGVIQVDSPIVWYYIIVSFSSTIYPHVVSQSRWGLCYELKSSTMFLILFFSFLYGSLLGKPGSSHGRGSLKDHINPPPPSKKSWSHQAPGWPECAIERCKLFSQSDSKLKTKFCFFGGSVPSDEEGPPFVPNTCEGSQSLAYFHISIIIKSNTHFRAEEKKGFL